MTHTPIDFCAPSPSEYRRTRERLAKEDAGRMADRTLRIKLAVNQAESEARQNLVR